MLFPMRSLWYPDELNKDNEKGFESIRAFRAPKDPLPVETIDNRVRFLAAHGKQ